MLQQGQRRKRPKLFFQKAKAEEGAIIRCGRAFSRFRFREITLCIFLAGFTTMFEFTEQELRSLIPQIVGLKPYGKTPDVVLIRLKERHNGYGFNPGAQETVLRRSRFQNRHAFNVRGVREHIHDAGLTHTPSARVHENGKVTRKRCRIARHVDHTGRLFRRLGKHV